MDPGRGHCIPLVLVGHWILGLIDPGSQWFLRHILYRHDIYIYIYMNIQQGVNGLWIINKALTSRRVSLEVYL